YTLLVKHCKNGMTGTVEEYQDFVSIRKDIETVLHDPDFIESPEKMGFIKSVDYLDDEFRNVTLDLSNDIKMGESWWYCRIPKVGNREFANSVSESYGLVIQEL